MFDIHSERKIEVNKWVIKARWFYVFGILIIGFLTKIISKSNIHFSYLAMTSFVVAFVLFNYIFLFFLRKIIKNKSEKGLNILGWFQVFSEVIGITYIMHLAGGVESIATTFFFLPVTSASLLFGARGAIVTALFSAFFSNGLVLCEYYNIIPHIYRYGQTTLEFTYLSIGLTKTVTISIFYLVIGTFSGFGSNLLFRRELSFEEKRNQLDQKVKLLAKRDKKLLEINNQLFEIKNKISAIINNFTDPIIFINVNNEISILNPASKKILGLSEEDLGKRISSKDNFSMNNFKELIKHKFKTKKIIGADKKSFEEIVIKSKNDYERTYKITTVVVSGNNNSCYGHIKVFYDLTREKVIDKLKSEFISIAAHQLRTPLTAIKWIMKMMLDGDAGKLNKDQKELINKGYASNERIINLVNDLLNVSRIEEGRFGFKMNYYNFEDVLNLVISNSKETIKNKKLLIHINKPDKLPQVYIDKERIVMVLQNLVDNAIKYTPFGKEININVKVVDDKELKITIKDNGVGIPEKEQKKLFTKFFRASNVVRMETEGTGLGLFIAKNIIEKHNGRIYIKSKIGQGTEASFTLPLFNS